MTFGQLPFSIQHLRLIVPFGRPGRPAVAFALHPRYATDKRGVRDLDGAGRETSRV